MAKLSVNAMIGLWARSGRRGRGLLPGLRLRGGGMVWDFVYARRLLSNGTYRPIHDAVLGFEHCMVAKARRILDAPPRYLAQVKTDCLLTQRLPKRFTERLRALEALRHPDGTPVYRVEETKPLLGGRAPRMEAERPKQRRWNGVDDPISHCANRALAPEGSKLLELETHVIHIDLGCCDSVPTQTPQNSPQSMRVCRGCASSGPAERYPRASLWPWRKWSRTE